MQCSKIFISQKKQLMRCVLPVTCSVAVFTITIFSSSICRVNGWAWTVSAQAGNSRPPTYCQDGPLCKDGIHPDTLGGWGLKPMRHYRIDFDGSPVCKTINDALNNALTISASEAVRRVTFPMPPAPAGESGPRSYQSQSAVFSDPIFLKWKPLGGFLPHGFAADPADWTDRWLVVALNNDGQRYLVKNNGEIWDVPEEAIDQVDWTKPANWTPYKLMQVPWPGAPAEAAKTNPIDSWRELGWSVPGTDKGDSNRPDYLSKFKRLANGDYPVPWNSYERWIAWPQFAVINNRVYTILFDTLQDQMVVDDIGRRVGDDLCYISSNIDRKHIYP